MKSLAYVIITLMGVAIISCDYSQDDQYTEITQIAVSAPGQFVADSVSVSEFRVDIPGVKYGPPIDVTLKTNWGTWSNKQKEIIVRAAYDVVAGKYTAVEMLRAEKTVTDFSVDVSTKDMYYKFQSNTTVLLPDRIFLVPDSVEMNNKPGNRTAVRVMMYSDKGRPSYGLKLTFNATNNALLDPVEIYYTKENLKTTVILPFNPALQRVDVGVTIEGATPVVSNATIHIK